MTWTSGIGLPCWSMTLPMTRTVAASAGEAQSATTTAASTAIKMDFFILVLSGENNIVMNVRQRGPHKAKGLSLQPLQRHAGAGHNCRKRHRLRVPQCNKTRSTPRAHPALGRGG